MGLAVTVLPQESSATPGTVLELNPVGTVPKGSQVVVMYAVPKQAVTTAPASTPSPTPSTAPQSALPDCTAGQLPGVPPTCKP